ncbi:MAG: creatininase family protein [Gemmatimonadaceae bacterium]|jgi:ribonuclease BN (tRNA processing enzyme)/creatinine amidohydrolase/Fe(II)-dependent formamide hydrolase-like protein|nr:creatininase family protein [Gemmatimonadaceae bacterium]
MSPLLARLLALGGCLVTATHLPAQPAIILGELPWPEARARLTPDAIVVIPLGAESKEHGPHLKLDNDRRLADWFTARVRASSDVIIAPTINYHFYPAFVDYAGSTTLRFETARDMVVDIVRAIARHGPRRFYVLNTGVSTMRPLAASAAILAEEGVLLAYTNILTAGGDAETRIRQQREGTHADELETSMMLYMDSSAVDMQKAVREYAPITGGTESSSRLSPVPVTGTRLSPSGVYGDATLATREKGRIISEATVASMLREIATLRTASLPPAVRPLASAAFGRTEPPPADSLKVVMLGTGTPNADPERSGPAVALVRGGRSYLVDAGAGVVRRAALAAQSVGDALAPPAMRTVFLTHLHSDHTAGLPDLMLMPWVLERTTPLLVVGPPGTRRMVDHLLAAYAEDRAIRLDGGEPSNPTGWRVTVREVTDGEVYRDDQVTVRALRVPHGRWTTALAYRFEARDRRVVISGDTGPSTSLADFCDGCDLLVHETYSTERFATRPPAWQRYHAAYHTSTTELAALATRARTPMLLLYHQLYWGATDAELVREVTRAGFTGRVYSARDAMVY